MTNAGFWPNHPRTQFVWWFPEWCGVGFTRWDGRTLDWMYRWSILLGFCEVRRWRPFVEAINFYKAREDTQKGSDNA